MSLSVGLLSHLSINGYKIGNEYVYDIVGFELLISITSASFNLG